MYLLCAVGGASLAAAAGFVFGRAVGDREIDWWRRQCEAMGRVLRDHYRADDELWRVVGGVLNADDRGPNQGGE